MKKRTNLLALVLSITAITFTLLGCSSDTGQKKSIAAPGSATEPVEAQRAAELMEAAQMRASMSRCL